MRADVLGSLISVSVLVVTVIVIARLRQLKTVYVCDFQRGVGFSGGRFTVLPPGLHFSKPGNNLALVDMRPHQFILERQFCKDALLSKCVVSLSGELQVCDAQLAVVELKNPVNDSLTVIQETLAPEISRSIVETTPEGRVNLAAALTSEFNTKLQSRGVELRKLDITELWAQPSTQGISTAAN